MRDDLLLLNSLQRSAPVNASHTGCLEFSVVAVFLVFRVCVCVCVRERERGVLATHVFPFIAPPAEFCRVPSAQ